MHARTPLRVLVIEDCEDDHELLLLKLREAGFEPSALRVETIAEIDQALVGSWQIVVSDFDLPGFDGLRALELVRARNAEVPFFIVSGVIDEEQAVAAMKAGAQDYFFKGKLARLGPALRRELHEAEQRRRRSEAQVQLDHDRKLLRQDRIRFVDVMSHELRTPLNIINVAAGMLAKYGDRMDGGDRGQRLSEIHEAVERMTRVIDKVLLTSRLELRRWDLRCEMLNVSVWCERFLAREMGSAGDRQRIQLQVLDAAPAEFCMDERVVEIALQNLLSNALKYSPASSPVYLEVAGDAGHGIRLTVRDHGIGIPESDLPHVMDLFYRAGNVGEVPGTGLGLAIAKGCAELHGGRIEVRSQAGQGTTISICLPESLEAPGAPEGVFPLHTEVTQG